MEQDPKPYVVYWMSQFAGTNPGYSTPKFQPNMMTFETIEQARAFYEKMTELADVKGTYRGRIVLHVSGLFKAFVTVDEAAKKEVDKQRRIRAMDFNTQSIIGKTVRANHPITCLNPDEWFKVVDARFDDNRLYVIGKNTCWFSLGNCDIKEE